MSEDIVKEGFKRAEESLREEEITKIKEVVKATLEKLSQKERSRAELDEEIKLLKKDIDDLRDGRIDKIKERQDIDKKARDISVIVIKEKVVERVVPSPWYIPWVIEIKKEYIPYYPQPVWINGYDGTASNPWTFTTTNSMTHMHVTGTYQLSDGTIRYL